jgi:HlyD family secretion protein
MSTSQSSQSSRTFSARRKSLVGAVIAAIAIGLVAGVSWSARNRVAGGKDAPAVFETERGPLTISVTESGTIQNRDLVIVKSELEGSATVLYLIPEGTTVQKGDLLVELDSSRLVDDRTQQEISVQNAEASFIRARENLAVTKSQSESDISRAKLDYEFAQLDLRKYEEGDYPQEVRQAEADITIATEELQRANEQLDWSRKLAEKKFITRTELQADELAAKRRELDLKLARDKLTLLTDYTNGRRLAELKSNVDQAKAALERVTRKGTADIVQAEADLKAKESEFNRQKAQLEKLGRQIEKCRIVAPVAGMAVYSTTGKPQFRGSAEPLAEGQQIRERQELIYLPVTTSMMAQVKIHESSLRKIKKDQSVRVTVDAVPGRVFQGRVGRIGLLPDAQSSWMNPDLKVYDTNIHLEGDAKELRAGMTCKGEIIVATYPDALYVPVQSVVRVLGRPTVYLPRSSGPVAKEVEIGLDNNRMVHVLSGLEAGEKVLLAPPLGPSTAPIVAEQPETTGTSREPASAVEVPAAPASPDAAGTTPADPATLRNMTREERQKFLESLTPEQRDALRQRTNQGEGGQRNRRRDAATPAEGQ